MEYTIANIPFEGSRQIENNLFVSGIFEDLENSKYLLDGYIVDSKYPTTNSFISVGLKDNTAIGAYNLLVYNNEKHILEIKTDKRAFIPLYIYEKNNHFALSNNPWILAKIFSNDVTISIDSLKAQLLYVTDYHPTRTLFSNISRIGVGSYIKYDILNNKKELYQNYRFIYKPNTSLELDDFFGKVDEDFTFYFQKIKEKNEGLIAGFGCSGGLDSRLIAHYADKVGIISSPYVFGVKKPHYFWKSTTAKTSELIGKQYGLSVKFIPYSLSWLYESLLLDIRNHPFFFTQAFINPIYDLPSYDYMLAGDPGGYAYLTDRVMSGSIAKLKEHAAFYLGLKKDSVTGLYDKLRKSAHHLHIKFNPYEEKGLLGLKHSAINKLVSQKDQFESQEELYGIIDSFEGGNNIEKWFNIHDNITTKYMFSSGYDSINHTKRCYVIYYPFFYERISEFPLNYFENKFFLKNFIKYINPSLLDIPDQNLNLVLKKQNHLKGITNRMELAFRGRGLQFLHFLKSKEYQKIVQETFDQDNPVFYSLVDKMNLERSGVMETYAGVQYLKLKMICDILYRKDFDKVLNNLDYSMVRW